MWWQVSDGLLYNYFEDKEDLLASALLAHVGAVMSATPRLPEPGTGTWPFDVNSLRRMGEAFGGHLHKPTPSAAANSTSPPQAYQARHTLPADQRFTFRQADRTVAGIGSAGPLLIRVSPPSSGTGHRQLSGCADVT
jgi:AcrR family transcriptional regulator